jgi:chromosome segregation protein
MISLKALELFGFKSFADRTRFEFPAGVTAVVGPNGSGKSNVVDAIKWVLGEQSVRSLRGKEMTDVIFAGSAGRRPLNMAEVSLVFDNSTRELPLQTDEVQIMRRVYRSGESEYLVNGETSRLKDIRELFSGTGAATEAYSVIEQGRVDALLVASGRDRRVVFEEAAGITRFRTRRTEALRRLERAEQNRQRLADIVGEVSARLETVRNQAARARRWRNLSDRLRVLRLVAARQDLAGVDADVAAVEEALATDRDALQAAEARGTVAGRLLADLAAAAEAGQPRLTAARADSAAAAQREAAATATLGLHRGRGAEVAADIDRESAALAQAIAEARQAARDAEGAEASATQVAESLAAIEARLAACERAAAGSHDHAATARAELAAALSAADALRHQAVRLEAALESAAARTAAAAEAARAARDATAAARGLRARLEEGRAAAEGHRGSLELRLAAAQRDVQAAELAHRGMANRLQQAWHTLADDRAAAEACRERRDVLRELIARQEGLSDAARRLLVDRQASVPGLIGPLADTIIAPVDYAGLVDLALGRLGAALLVERLADAIAWHAAAADTTAEAAAVDGRIVFVSADGLPEPADYTPPSAPGLVGRLDRLIRPATPPEPLSPEAPAAVDGSLNAEPPDSADLLTRRLLGHAWVVDRIDQALPLVETAPNGLLFIARDGACLSAGGGFEAGSGGGSSGQIARRSELRAVETRTVQLAADVERTTAQVAALQMELEQLAQEAQAARSRRQRATDALAAAQAELDRVARDERQTDDAIAAAEATLHDAERRTVAAEATERAARDDLERVRRAVTQSDEETAARRTAIESLEQSRGEAIEEVQRLRVERAAAQEKLDHARIVATSSATAARRLRDDVAAATTGCEAAAGRRQAWERQVLTAEAALAEAAWTAERAAARLAAAEAEAACRDRSRREQEREQEQARSTAASLGERIHARELEAGDARHARVRIVERIRDEYDLDIEAIAPDEAVGDPEDPPPDDRADLERLIEDHRRKLAGMGNVNLEALTEADELAGRLATLEAQLADVTSGREAIEALIARIDEESRRLLSETIETVRGHFRELFERVFGGGQADLVLEPGVDLLESSVEILARPPGKEPRSISLLSGGEKTMTCVALLLAIFRSSPSPFCVLDEVDAALDEANVDRFVGVLRDFMSATQFIVVTHSKKTMAAAGTIYGVTQEESGISKRVAVRFESAAQGAGSRGISRAA